MNKADLALAYSEGQKAERKKTIKLINELLLKYYEDGADEFARQLEFALSETNAGVKE